MAQHTVELTWVWPLLTTAEEPVLERWARWRREILLLSVISKIFADRTILQGINISLLLDIGLCNKVLYSQKKYSNKINKTCILKARESSHITILHMWSWCIVTCYQPLLTGAWLPQTPNISWDSPEELLSSWNLLASSPRPRLEVPSPVSGCISGQESLLSLESPDQWTKA